MTKHEEQGLYGVIAEFDDPNAVVAAARQTYAAGFRRINAYSPYPIEELAEAIGFHKNMVARTVFVCGILGLLGGLSLQLWTSTIAYPIVVGGRPLVSIPAFIPVTFECTVLGAALTCFVGMWVLNGLPMPYHPVFNVPAFARASHDRFFLMIESADPRFDRAVTQSFLEGLHPVGVTEVAP